MRKEQTMNTGSTTAPVAEQTESFEYITGEMRAFKVHLSTKKRVSGASVAGVLEGLADRLDEAWKRECICNVAAIRDALIKAKDNFDEIGKNALIGQINEDALTMVCASMSGLIAKVLAAPARNCDKYTSENDAKRAFLDCRNKLFGSDCDLGDLKHNIDGITEDYAEWLLASAEKGDTE